jgi:hypothetical protein
MTAPIQVSEVDLRVAGVEADPRDDRAVLGSRAGGDGDAAGRNGARREGGDDTAHAAVAVERAKRDGRSA